MMIIVFENERSHVGKGENAGYLHFLFCPHGIPRGSLKFGIVWLTLYQTTKSWTGPN